MNRTIRQIPCPSCDHEQHDMVMTQKHLVKYDRLESICEECGETFIKPIEDTSDEGYDRETIPIEGKETIEFAADDYTFD